MVFEVDEAAVEEDSKEAEEVSTAVNRSSAGSSISVDSNSLAGSSSLAGNNRVASAANKEVLGVKVNRAGTSNNKVDFNSHNKTLAVLRKVDMLNRRVILVGNLKAASVDSTNLRLT